MKTIATFVKNNIHLLEDVTVLNSLNGLPNLLSGRVAVFNKTNIIIVFRDHLGDDSDFLSPIPMPGNDRYNDLIKYIQAHPDQKFWIFSGIFNLNQIEKTLSNVKVIDWTEEMFQIDGCHYITITPQREKNFKSEKHWINLSQNKRIHRQLIAMYLLGENLDQTGLLKFDPSELFEHESWDSYVGYWKHNNREKEITQILSYSDTFKTGFYKVKNYHGYERNQYQNATDLETKIFDAGQYHKNFEIFLKPLYRNSVIEIVSETIFMREYGIISEKFLNSVYGFNLPIILNVAGAVKKLRSIGFDMFDSVIDHSYDLITDPIPRLIHALESNKSLLENSDLARDSWKKCLPGLEHNFQLAQELERNLESTFKSHLIQINNATRLESKFG